MPESDSAFLTFANTFIKETQAAHFDHDFASRLCKDMTLVSASQTPKTRLVSRLTVTLPMCNPLGVLHGGAICTLFDVCTTVALGAARKWENLGVTRSLSTTCLVPVLPGEEIEIEAEVLQVGKKMAHIIAKMTLVKSNKLVATGVHDKAYVDPRATMSGRGSKL